DYYCQSYDTGLSVLF
nr:immunoglobulin light chain junction region [Macaca mulatta]MOY05888.1 immunoglobulin light chain junction region [Macaca mulatta]MOY06611.1 immunoglobulin light chain junction region [Macaca mulatta]MOY08257.1 immunoglobulin light chain junction region [Macaca mulatta]MOY08643.1 immunoglobulin light chain junction region [Macaca mulatta]